MSDEARFCRLISKTARALAAALCAELPDGWTVSFNPPHHSDAQRALMHSMAGDLAKQVPWCGQKMSKDDWKRFCTAKLKKDRFVFDCDEFGKPDTRSIVSLGCTTRDKDTKFLGAMITWFEWMGAQHGVTWTHEQKRIERLDAQRRAQPREDEREEQPWES